MFLSLYITFHFQNCHELEKMDLEECVQVKCPQMVLPLCLSGGSESLMLVFVSDHRWNTYTVVHPLPPFASPGECVSVSKHILSLFLEF